MTRVDRSQDARGCGRILAVEQRDELQEQRHVGPNRRRVGSDEVARMELVRLSDQIEECVHHLQRPAIDVAGVVRGFRRQAHPGQGQRTEPTAEVERAFAAGRPSGPRSAA